MLQNLAPHLETVSREAWDEGLSIDILSRLSVKRICSWKAVCKSWHALIREKHFTKKQLAHSRENPAFILNMDTGMELYSVRPGSSEVFALNRINPAEQSEEYDMYMIASFNGLICCINSMSDKDVEKGFSDLQIWICNPCTGETLLLPQGTPSFKVEPIVGVAYASDISDYRVFRIFCTGKKIPKERVPSMHLTREFLLVTRYSYALAYECEVYSSSTGTWKNIAPLPRAPMLADHTPYNSAHVFVGGKIYWLVFLNYKYEILSVDLEGRFKVISFPDEELTVPEDIYLIVLQESLSVVSQHRRHMHVWRWQEEKEEWENVYQDEKPFDVSENVLAVASLKNEILCVTKTEWWTYNVDTGIWDKRVGPPTKIWNPSIFPFTESLLTCNGGLML